MLKRMLFTSLLATPFFVQSASEQVEPKSRLIETYIAAEPVERAAPKYPRDAARNGQSGWVQMSFVVDEEGKVKDVMVLDNSGPKSFIKEARKAVKKWQYSPASVNGESIEQCENTVQLDFAMGGDHFGKVSRKFNKIFKKGKLALQNNDMEGVKQALDTIDELAGMSPAERYWRYNLAIFYYEKTGDAEQRYRALLRADSTIGSTYLKADEKEAAKAYLLRELFIYQTQNSLFALALENFERLEKLLPETAKNYQQYAGKIKEIVNGNQHVFVDGKINEYGNWSHSLARNSFALTEIKGNLGKLEVRCDKKRSVYTAVEGSQWNVPESWGECTVLISGDENSSVTLVEINS